MAVAGLGPGFVPAIHVFELKRARKTWMPATIPASSPATGMTPER
jgi:hypothetical protein